MTPIIDIWLDGKLFAMRNTWALVPRVGDTLVLKNGEVFLEVTRVAWGDTSEANGTGLDRQWVQLVCKTIGKE